jgi:inhibitor of KinA
MLQHALEEPLVLKKSTLHTIPVCYELEQDLSAAAIELGVSIQTLVHLHCSKTYICSTVGFVPGFAYLGDLAPEIATLKRLSTPRISVDAGSVAIAGKQTAVYPTSTPGGWWIIGKTPLMLVNEAEGYFPIAAGDRVTFRRIGRDEFETMRDCRL